MSKYTPGPWMIGERRKDDNVLQLPIVKQIDEDDPKSSYCVAWIVTGGPSIDDMANARLIAAAPKLLEALREIAKDQYGSSGKIARDAVAEVEGK